MVSILVLQKANGRLATTAPRSKWRTIPPSIGSKCDKTSYWKCIHDTFYVLCRAHPHPPVPVCPLHPRALKKVEVYLLVLRIIALWRRKMSRLASLKTLESAYMHRELGRRGRFTSRRSVTGAAWRRTPLPITPFFPMLILLFKEVFKGKRLLFRRSFAAV